MKYIYSLIGLALLTVIVLTNSPETKADKQLGKTDTDKGVTFTIDNYEKEGSNLRISYTVSSESELKEDWPRQPFVDRPTFYIDQKHLNTSYSEEIKKINSHTYTGYILLNNIEKEHFNLKMKIYKISDYVGTWELGVAL